MTELLSIGDKIVLFCDDRNGYMFCDSSSSTFNCMKIQTNQNKDSPQGVHDIQAYIFEVYIQNRYKLLKKYQKLYGDLDQRSESFGTKLQMDQAKAVVVSEENDNISEQNRHLGKPVYYGDVIQLRHLYTQKYIHVDSAATGVLERSNMTTRLGSHNDKTAHFRIVPRYKAKFQGEAVKYHDIVKFESLKYPSHYFHASEPFQIEKLFYGSEMNIAIEPSGFIVLKSLRYDPQCQYAHILKGGDYIQIMHKELDAYLSCEKEFELEAKPDVFLRPRKLDISPSSNNFHFSSCPTTFWQVEYGMAIFSADSFEWSHPIRLRHSIYRLYLCVKTDLTVTMTKHGYKPSTVFQFYPQNSTDTNIRYNTNCRIKNVSTGAWLHIKLNEIWTRENTMDRYMASKRSVSDPEDESRNLRQLYCASQKLYDDAFVFYQVPPATVTSFNQLSGYVPFISNLLNLRKTDIEFTIKESYNYKVALQEVSNDLQVNQQPNKMTKGFLRNLGIVDLLVEVVLQTFHNPQDEKFAKKVYWACYDLLHNFLRGGRAKNSLYFARHMISFREKMLENNELGNKVAEIVTELLRNNETIIQSVRFDDLLPVIDSLRMNPNAQYLEYLCAFCTCNGRPLVNNQRKIANKLLAADQQGLFRTEKRRNMELDTDIIYITTDIKTGWMRLHEFLDEKSAVFDEGYKNFFLKQMDLYLALCYGRNSYCLDLIVKQLKLVTWEECFTGIGSSHLPYYMRTKYFELIETMFIDIGSNYSVVDNPRYNFEYLEVKDELPLDVEFMFPRPREKITSHIFPSLSSWIYRFLERIPCLVQTDIEQNYFLQIVFNITNYLVKYGYYGGINLRRIMRSLMRLLNGRLDLPFQCDSKKDMTRDRKMLVMAYTEKGRFADCPETQAIIAARLAGLDILDSIFIYERAAMVTQLLNRYSYCDDCFNSRHSERNPKKSTLVECLLSNFNVDFHYEISPRISNLRRAEIEAMFTEARFIDPNQWTGILLDLAHYEHDLINQKSLHILRKLYSIKEASFHHAFSSFISLTPQSKHLQDRLANHIPSLRLMTKSTIGSEQLEKINDILSEMINDIKINDSGDALNHIAQRIIVSFGAMEVVFQIITQFYRCFTKVQMTNASIKLISLVTELLRLLTISNQGFKEDLFNQLDPLLDLYLHSHPPELAYLLRDGIFLDNASYCGRLKPYQINRFVLLAAKYGKQNPLLGGAFLHLLEATAAVNYGELPIRRNQLLVMKFLMKNYSQVLYLLDPSALPISVLLTTYSLSDDTYYFTRLVDLLCACCEGDNQYVHSLAQTIISMEDAVELLVNKEINVRFKRGLMKYLTKVYLNKAAVVNQEGAIRIFIDSSYCEELIDDIHKAVRETILMYKRIDQVDLAALLKNAFDSKSTPGADMGGNFQSYLTYIVSGASIFMSGLCTTWSILNVILPKKTNAKVTEINYLIIDLFSQLWKFQLHPGVFLSMTETVIQLLPYSNMTYSSAKAAVYRHCKTECFDNDPRKEIDSIYADEIDRNLKLQTFIFNCSQIIFGPNSTRAQLNVSVDKKYIKERDPNSLPLNVEFQNHFNAFINPYYSKGDKRRYKLIQILIKQLQVSGKLIQGKRYPPIRCQSPISKVDQDALDLRSAQILRALYYNEECIFLDNLKLNIIDNEVKEGLAVIAQIQNILNDMNLSSRIQLHIINPCDAVSKQTLSLQSAMLMNGNHNVQETLLKYFRTATDEVLFNAIKELLQNAFNDMKEQKKIVPQKRTAADRKRYSGKESDINIDGLAEKMYKRLEGYEKRYKKRFKCQAINESFQMRKLTEIKFPPRKSEYCPFTFCHKTRSRKKRKTKNGYEDIDSVEMDDFELEYGMGDDTIRLLSKDSGESPDLPTDSNELMAIQVDPNQQVTLVLQLLSNMCLGQFTGLQDYLREQTDNRISVNVVTLVVNFLGNTYSNIQPNTILLNIMAFETIKEAVLGNQKNRLVAYQAKVIDYANYVLRNQEIIRTCDLSKSLDLWMNISRTVLAIIEENGSEATVVAKDACSTIDREAIYRTMDTCYRLLQDTAHQNQETMLYNVGYNYFLITARLDDLENDFATDESEPPEDYAEAHQFFKNYTCSIEILKGDDLQRLRFPIEQKEILREDVKEKIKWALDRSSPSNKIRSFMEWSKLIVPDMGFQKQVIKNPTLNFLTKQWITLNALLLILSFIINILLIVGLQAPVGGFIGLTGPLPIRDTNFDNRSILWIQEYRIFGTVIDGIAFAHITTASLILLTYIVTDRPSFVTLTGYYRSLKVYLSKLWSGIYGFSDDDDEDEIDLDATTSAVSLFSMFQFMYLCVSLGLSIYGLWLPYVYAFHMFNIIQNNQLLMGVIASVTRNGRILLWVAVLLLIIMYIYSIFAFCFYRSTMNPAQFLYSATLFQTFMTTIRFGIVGDLYQYLLPNDEEKKTITMTMQRFGSILVFQLLFYVTITITGLNIIFGIIIDTFSELRNLKDTAESDMKSICFICARPGHDFEQSGRNFKHHIDHEHNMWDYFFYFHYLKQTNVNDYSHLDLYVADMIEKKNFDFFPTNRSLTLMKESTGESKIEEIYRNVQIILEHRKQEEKERIRRKNVLKQSRWRLNQQRPERSTPSSNDGDGQPSGGADIRP